MIARSKSNRTTYDEIFTALAAWAKERRSFDLSVQLINASAFRLRSSWYFVTHNCRCSQILRSLHLHSHLQVQDPCISFSLKSFPFKSFLWVQLGTWDNEVTRGQDHGFGRHFISGGWLLGVSGIQRLRHRSPAHVSRQLRRLSIIR